MWVQAARITARRGGLLPRRVAALRPPRSPQPRVTPTVREAEVMTVGTDEVVVTFVTDPGETVTSRVGDQEVTTVGPHHFATFTGLDPSTEYPVTVDGAPADEFLPASVRRSPFRRGSGSATLATVNDVHFGEFECGRSTE